MYTKITMDSLTESGVSIKTQNYIMVDGIESTVGEPSRCAYANNTRGRELIKERLPEPYLSSVMAVWGDTPTAAE